MWFTRADRRELDHLSQQVYQLKKDLHKEVQDRIDREAERFIRGASSIEDLAFRVKYVRLFGPLPEDYRVAWGLAQERGWIPVYNPTKEPSAPATVVV